MHSKANSARGLHSGAYKRKRKKVREFDPIRYKAATAVFKLAVKTCESGMHRITNREPKGKGWVQCANVPTGVMCKPEKLREGVEYFKIAYEVWPDIVALNQIALFHEMLGESEQAKAYFERMKRQADDENNEAYGIVASQGIARNA